MLVVFLCHFHFLIDKQLSLHIRFWYVLLLRVTKAQANMHICEDVSEISLLAYTKYGCI